MKIKHLLLTVLIGLSGLVAATDFTVTQAQGNGSSANVGSFAWAVNQANNDNNTPHTIKFAPSLNGQGILFTSVISLTRSDVTFDGENQNITLQPWNSGELLQVHGNNITFKNLRVNSNIVNSSPILFKANTTGHLIDNCRFFSNFWFGKNTYPWEPGNAHINKFDNPKKSIIKNSTFDNDLSILGEENSVQGCTIGRSLIIGNTTGTWPTKAGLKNNLTNLTIGTNSSSSEARIIIVGFDNVLDDITFFGKTAVILGERNTIKNSKLTTTNNPNADDVNVNTSKWFNTQACIQIQEDNNYYPQITVKDNVIKNNILRTTLNIDPTININGIRVIKQSSNDSIYNNNIQGFYNGILIRNQSTKTVIAENKVSNSFLDGIRILDASEVIITKNSSFSNKDNGIHIESGSSKNIALGNKLWSNVNGIQLNASLSNKIDSNFVGLDTLGLPKGNTQWGIKITSSSSSNKIGETKGNFISANKSGGINITSSSFNEVYNNYIGRINPIDSTDLGTTFENDGSAILINNGAASNIVGAINKGNIIAKKANTSSVIIVNGSSTRFNRIQANSTYCNAGKGIELQNGGNQSFALNNLFINRAPASTTELFVKAPTTTEYFDLYIADTSCSPTCSATGDGNVTQQSKSQGRTFLRRVNISSLGTPNSLGDYTIPLNGNETIGAIALTATDGNSNTSEFAACRHEVLCKNPEVTNFSNTGDSKNGFCDGTGVDISVLVNTADVSYVWKLNGTKITNATTNTLSVTDGGVYTVTVMDNIDTNICRVDTAITIVKYNNPVISGINGPDSTCFDINDKLTYTTTSLGNSHSYTWSHNGSVSGTKNVGDTSYTASNFNVQPVSKVSLTVTNDTTTCTDSKTFDVNVFDNPVIDTITGDRTVQCGADGFTYTVSSNLGNANYVWTINGPGSIVAANGADSSSVTVNFDDATSATGFVVTLTATAINPATGCQSTSPYNATVRLIGCGLKADFGADTTTCLNTSLTKNNIIFSDASSTDQGVNIVKWEWDFGTDATPQTVVSTTNDNQTVFYTSTGSKTIKLKITDADGGIDSIVKTDYLVVNPTPVVRTIKGDTILCEGDKGTHFIENAGTKEVYSWTYTQDATLDSDVKGDTATVLAGSSNFLVNVNVTDSNACSIAYTPFSVDVVQNIKSVSILAEKTHCTSPGKTGSYFYVAETTGGNTGIDFKWTAEPTIDSLVTYYNAVFNGVTEKTLSMSFGKYVGPFTATVKATPVGTSCGSEKTATNKATVFPSFPVYFEFSKPITCKEDSVTHIVDVKWDGDNRPQPTDTEANVIGLYHWIRNTTDTISRPIKELSIVRNGDGTIISESWINTLNDTVSSRPNDNDTITVLPVTGDTLILAASNLQFCYDLEKSKLSDTVSYSPIDRPGADLHITSKDTEKLINFDGSSEVNINNFSFADPLLKLPFVELKDNTKRFTNDKLIFTFENVVSADSFNVINRQQTTNFIDVVPTAKNDQKYTLTYKLSVDNGTCIDTSYATLGIEFDYFIPNAFTPTNDGQFDTWVIENLEKYTDVKVEIYNRWGNLVYTNNSYDNSWAGVNNSGNKLPFGTYFYIVDFNVEGIAPRSGSVSIIK